MSSNKDNTFNIIVAGKVKDFDGMESECEYNVLCDPNDTVKSFISNFFKIYGLEPSKYKLYKNKENLEKYGTETLSQIGMKNNLKIDLAFVEEEGYFVSENAIPKNYQINIKFLKSTSHSVFNCKQELNGILKLCLLNEIVLKIDNSILDTQFSLKKIPDKIYFVLKILKQSNPLNNKDNDDQEKIKHLLEMEKGKNIMNFSNFADEIINQDRLNEIMELVPKSELNNINDTILRLGKYKNYMEFLEKELDKSMRRSHFEFSPVSIAIIDRKDFDDFEKERRNCPNRVEKLLFHGTPIHPASCILTGIFRKSETAHYQHGKGVYFSDLLDYSWFYGGVTNRSNMNIIPKIGDTFTAICSMVYYKEEGWLKVKDYKTREYPGKNEINFAYAGATFETLKDPIDWTKFVATEYVVWHLEQVCPLISIKFRREEYVIVWRDDNFSKKAIWNNKFDNIFKTFLGQCIKYIRQSAKYNVYPCQTTEEALEIIKRKKYNKIILISNVGPNLGGKTFVEEARKIIGDVIVMFLAYNADHLNWITKTKNALFSNESEFYEEYLDSFGSKSKMDQLIEKLQKHYKVKFNIDGDYLKYEHYKSEGKYSKLEF